MYTFAPFCTNADAIILPMPDPPPVTTAGGAPCVLTMRWEDMRRLTDFAAHIEEGGDAQNWKTRCQKQDYMCSRTDLRGLTLGHGTHCLLT